MKHEDIDRIAELLRYVELRGQTVLDEAHFEESLGNLLTELSALRERTRPKRYGDEKPERNHYCLVLLAHDQVALARYDVTDEARWRSTSIRQTCADDDRWIAVEPLLPLPEAPQ